MPKCDLCEAQAVYQDITGDYCHKHNDALRPAYFQHLDRGGKPESWRSSAAKQKAVGAHLLLRKSVGLPV